jgi:predicted transcriptional regulator
MTNDGEKITASNNEVGSKMDLALQAVLEQLKELKDISTDEDQLVA